MEDLRDSVVNGKSLPDFALRMLLALRLLKIKTLSDFGYPESQTEYYNLDANVVQTWINDFIKSRNLPDPDTNKN